MFGAYGCFMNRIGMQSGWFLWIFYRRYFVAAIYYSVVDWVFEVVGF